MCCSCASVGPRQAIDEALAAPSAPMAADDSAGVEIACDTNCEMAPPPPEAPPLPSCACATGNWVPPGIACPWPPTEYLCDGGDRDLPAAVDEDWQIFGLETEDTIAHYDTLSGCRVVTPSNRVCLYAPRFGSVRKVVNPLLNEQVDAPGGIAQPEGLVRFDERQEPTSALQHSPLQVNIARKTPNQLKSESAGVMITEIIAPDALQDALLPYENVSVIRIGKYQNSDKPLLARGLQAAIVWTDTQAVQVLLDHQAANEVVGDRRVEAVYTVKEQGCPMLRLIKVASTQSANPGDLVDFTLRFDNVGTEAVGNVTIVDSLTTRLEYVPKSAQASVKAKFSTEPNSAGALVLRWEITEPVEPQAGGVLHFTCRVR